MIVANAASASQTADSFVDSEGVNIHYGFYGTVYDTYNSAVTTAIEKARIRHVRDIMMTNNDPVALARDQRLEAGGVKFDEIIVPASTSMQVSSWIGQIGASNLDACEGPNEQDLEGTSNWAAQDRADQQVLFGVCAPLGLPVLAPSLPLELTDSLLLGSLATYSTNGNTHDYKQGFNPGWAGFGSNQPPYGIYGSTQFAIGLAQITTPNEPVWATETGYLLGSSGGAVPSDIFARYTLRTYLEHYLAGIRHTYIYDMANCCGDAYGLLDSFANPRSAYYAIGNLNSILADPGSPFVPSLASYTVSGTLTNLHQLELGKRDGTSYIVLYQEVQEWDQSSNLETAAKPEKVTVSLTKAQPTTAYRQMDDGSFTTTHYSSRNSMNFLVSGHVLILQVGSPATAPSLLFPSR